jgi:hypothetical protein
MIGIFACTNRGVHPMANMTRFVKYFRFKCRKSR